MDAFDLARDAWMFLAQNLDSLQRGFRTQAKFSVEVDHGGNIKAFIQVTHPQKPTEDFYKTVVIQAHDWSKAQSPRVWIYSCLNQVIVGMQETLRQLEPQPLAPTEFSPDLLHPMDPLLCLLPVAGRD
jgi:hypothetical protein